MWENSVVGLYSFYFVSCGLMGYVICRYFLFFFFGIIEVLINLRVIVFLEFYD